MSKLKWLSSFNTGIAEIDEDHRALFALAEQIGEKLVEEKADPGAAAMVQSFIDMAEAHFKREEEILRRAGFPEVNRHKIYHDGLLDYARSLSQICNGVTDRETARRCYDSVVNFLIDDVMRGDVGFKSYVEYHGVKPARA